MKPFRVVVALLLSWLNVSMAFADVRLVLHGSNTVGESLAPQLVEGWLGSRGCTGLRRSVVAPDHLQVDAVCGTAPLTVAILAFGTGTGFAELKAGRADLWMASRPVSEAELAQASDALPLTSPDHEHVIALDGLSVIVHPRNTLKSLSLAQLREIFAGRVTNWRALGGPDAPIVVHARDEKSGTWDSFKTLVMGATPLWAQAQRHESSTELSQAVQADPAAIGFVGLGAVGGSRALPIADGSAAAMAPGAAQVATEDYPLARRLFFYSGVAARPEALELIAFSLSDAGQRVVERTGFIGLSVHPVDLPVAVATGSAAADYRDVSASARRLGVNFRFSERTAELDSRAQRDIRRLVDFMQRPENRGRSLRLAGFADSSELAYGALVLSTDRADYVAMQLNRAGIAVSRVRGLGQHLPIADNATSSGRARNRRVEVWIDQDAGALATTARTASNRPGI